MSSEILKCKNQFFASCPSGLEELLSNEIRALEIEELETVKGGVHFECTETEKALELILSSRIASRIYRKAYKFEIKNEKDLYYSAKEIKWKALFSLDQTFKISVVLGKSRDGLKRSRYTNTMFLAQNLKDGIADRFRQDCDGERPSVNKEIPDISILLRIEPNVNIYSKKEEVTVLIDLCGDPLNRRGYRRKSVTAPLKENLAAGLVILSGYKGSENFIDPMCGSGTILIESLLIKGKIPPSFLKLSTPPWDFQNHLWFSNDKYLTEEWSALLEAYKEKVSAGYESLKDFNSKSYASDIARDSLMATIENLRAARLQEFAEVDKEDAVMLKPIEESGVLLSNPPYGERIGEEDELPELYYNLGENFKTNFTGWRAYIFTGNIPLIKKISLRTSKKIILWNGNIESRLVEYLMY